MTENPDSLLRPRTARDHLKALGMAAFMVVLVLLILEALLACVDPWGMRYFSDLAQMGNEVFIADEARGYAMAEGRTEYSRWSATIEDKARLTPASAGDGSCTLVVVGDSVAFGYGVDDTDVWLNQLAQDWPDVQVINLAVPRYNSTNVLRTLQSAPPADLYLYMIVNNDLEVATDPTAQAFTGGGEGQPWLVRYVNFALRRGDNTVGATFNAPEPGSSADDDPRLPRLLDELESMQETVPELMLVAFRDEPLTNSLITRDLDLLVVDYPREERISFVDYHLNPRGNTLLAEALRPPLTQALSQRCGTEAVDLQASGS